MATGPIIGRRVHTEPKITVWVTHGLKLFVDKDVLNIHFRGPESKDFRIAINRTTGAVTIPEGFPPGQNIRVTVQMGDDTPKETFTP